MMQFLISPCRFCHTELRDIVITLGLSPYANSYLTDLNSVKQELCCPLTVYKCHSCQLVQLGYTAPPENLFSLYAYFSSFSSSWLLHMEHYVKKVIERFKIDNQWKVIEIGSNDGYLLKIFKQHDIPILGIEPAENIARFANVNDINTLNEFFSTQLCKNLKKEGISADLLIGNNVLAHIPDINDCVKGMKMLLSKHGIITLELPHLLSMLENHAFDTIYHEHYFYHSVYNLQKIFKHYKLEIFDVEKLKTHGGSLRLYIKHASFAGHRVERQVQEIIQHELDYGIHHLDVYKRFEKSIIAIKNDLTIFLSTAKLHNKIVVGYGAPAKGNTLLNFCKLNAKDIQFTVDKNPEKINHYLPGSHIPIYHVDKIKEIKPDYVLILPWNLKSEIIKEHEYIKNWGGKFVVAVPRFSML